MNFQLHTELATNAGKQAYRQTRKVSKQKGSKTSTFRALMFWGELSGGIFHPEKALDLVLLGKGAEGRIGIGLVFLEGFISW